MTDFFSSLFSAYDWATKPKRNISYDVGNTEFEFSMTIPSEKAKEAGKTELQYFTRYSNFDWKSFDQYVKYFEKMFYSVTISKENWLTESKCTCIHFQKNYVCKHVIGLALRLKLTKCPSAAINVNLNSKPKLGRPARAKKALIVQ